MSRDIWILVQHKKGIIEDATFGLIAEGRRLVMELGDKRTLTAIALGSGLREELSSLGAYGADRVLYTESESLSYYQGELFARALTDLAKELNPSYILMVQTQETADLAPRLAVALETGLVTRAVDLKIDEKGLPLVIRPMANGCLFEETRFDSPDPHIVCFLASGLVAPEPDEKKEIEVFAEPLDEAMGDLQTKVVEVIEAPPEELGLEETDIIVSGGRGVGKGEAFDLIHELARCIGGSVAGTRPVIDWGTLPFERQIGQTGKSVSPRLMFACGISGANEFTAGMEKSRLIIAINSDPRARIFRFADLGVVGDLHEVVPILIERLKEIKESD